MAHGMASGDIAIAVCSRCGRKRPYTALGPDINFHGLRVCQDPPPGTWGSCADQLDPYRLPARQTEAISLRYPRPDISVANTTIFLVNDFGALLETENGSWLVISPGS
jgi:hypothetical protein